MLFEIVFGRTPPAYGHSLQMKLQASRKHSVAGASSSRVIMSHYDFLSSLRLRDDRLKTDSKHFSDLKLQNFPLVKDLLGRYTDKARSGTILAKAIENMSFANVVAGGTVATSGSPDKTLHEKRMQNIVDKFRVESRLRQQMMWREGKVKKEDVNGVISLFHHLDKDGDGELSAGEVRKFITQELELPLSQTEINSVIDELDVSGDGLVSIEEFGDFLKLKLDAIDKSDFILDVISMLSGGPVQAHHNE